VGTSVPHLSLFPWKVCHDAIAKYPAWVLDLHPLSHYNLGNMQQGRQVQTANEHA
jgi:hypothetical protein